MKGYKFAAGWEAQNWASPFYVVFDESNKTKHLGKSLPHWVDEAKLEVIDGILIPGFINAHSHCFQYAMAGLAEHTNPKHSNDSFWTWREMMYQLALQLTPDQFQAIATMAYSEMLRMGYVSVVEFHYLHHDPSGQPYKNPAELSERLIVAAEEAGIDLLLTPVFYQTGGFNKPATAAQRRFIFKSIDHYETLCNKLQTTLDGSSTTRLARGIHSLRAAPPEAISEIWRRSETPIHLHIAEQTAEVEQCVAIHGKRPVTYLIDTFGLDEHHHLVHATHLDASEVKRLATSKASVVLCPSTEANLGDGFFPLTDFFKLGGRWSIGSDSHVCLNPCEELRWLDYGVRLGEKRRNPLVNSEHLDSGELFYQMSYHCGRKSSGIRADKLNPYDWNGTFRGVVLDAMHPSISGIASERIFSSLIFASDPSVILGNLKASQWMVQKGQHRHQQEFRLRYLRSLKEIYCDR